MKIKKIKPAILVLLLFSLFGCDSMISDVDVPESEPKLVINSYISAENDTLKVNIQESRPLYVPSSNYEFGYPVVTDATVTISDGINSISLQYNDFEKKYIGITESFKIEAGSTYFLEVSKPGSELASANCTVPTTEVPEIEIINIETFNDYGYTEKVINFRFKDLKGKGDFYHVQSGMLYKSGYEGDFMGDVYFENGEYFVSDVNKDESYFLYKTSRISIQEPDQTELVIFIAVTDENYFNYHRSVDSFQGDNPFSEPTPVFSNITGGLGVFGSYSGRFISINLK